MVLSIVIPHDVGQRLWIEEVRTIGHFEMLVDGWLDFMEIPALGVTVYMNRGGKACQLPLNTRATTLWWYYSALPTERPAILGDVVLTGIVDGASSGDVPDRVIDQLLERDRFVVQVTDEAGAWHDTYARFDNFFDAAMWCLLFGLTMRPGPHFRVDVPAQSGSSA